jgi:hypothetical protein
VLAARDQFWQPPLPLPHQQQVQPHDLQWVELWQQQQQAHELQQRQQQLELGSADVLDGGKWDELMAAIGLVPDSDCQTGDLQPSSLLAAPDSAWPPAGAAAAAAAAAAGICDVPVQQQQLQAPDVRQQLQGLQLQRLDVSVSMGTAAVGAVAAAAAALACSVAQAGQVELLPPFASTVNGTVLMQHPSPAAVQRLQQQQQHMTPPGWAVSPFACGQLVQPAAQGTVMGHHPRLTPPALRVASPQASLAQGQQLAGPPLVRMGSSALPSPVAGAMAPALSRGSVAAACAPDAAASADSAVAAGLLVGVRTLEQALAFCDHVSACLGDLAQHLQQHFGPSSSSSAGCAGSSPGSATGVIAEWLEAGWFMDVLRCGDLLLSAGPAAISEAKTAAKAQPLELASPSRLALHLMEQLLLLSRDLLSLQGADAGVQQQGWAAVFVWEVLKQLQQGVEATQKTLSECEPLAGNSGGGGGESVGGSYGVMCKQLLHSYAAAQFGSSQVTSSPAAAGCTVLNLVQLL